MTIGKLIVAAIGTSALIYLVWKRYSTGNFDFVSTDYAAVGEMFMRNWKSFSESLSEKWLSLPTWESSKTSLSSNWELLKSGAGSGWDKITGAFGTGWEYLKSAPTVGCGVLERGYNWLRPAAK